MLLVTFSDDYADEFDVNGMKLFTNEEWDAYCKFAREKVVWGQGLYFGTNEGIEYDSAEDYLRCFDAKEISDEEAETIKKLIPRAASEYGYGLFLGLDVGSPEEYQESNPLW